MLHKTSNEKSKSVATKESAIGADYQSEASAPIPTLAHEKAPEKP
jgi:hypothetical protein